MVKYVLAFLLLYVLSFVYTYFSVHKSSENKMSNVHYSSTDTNGTINSYNVKSRWQIIINGHLTLSKEILSGKLDTLFINEDNHVVDTVETNGDNQKRSLYVEEYSSNSNYSIQYLIGPYLSYAYSYYGEGGAHPAYGSYYRTINLYDKKEVSLREIFPDSSIYISLLKDTIILNNLTNKAPKDLDNLVSSLDGGCEIDFRNILTSFSFGTAYEDSVEIVFGLTHGCEADRGNFTSIWINLPMNKNLAIYLP